MARLTDSQILENVEAIKAQGGVSSDVAAYLVSEKKDPKVFLSRQLTPEQQSRIETQQNQEASTSGLRNFLGITPQSELDQKRYQIRNEMEAKGYSPARILAEETIGSVKDAMLHTAQVAPLVLSAPIKGSLLLGGAALGTVTGGLKTIEELLKGEDLGTSLKRGITTGTVAGTFPAVIEGGATILKGGKKLLSKIGEPVEISNKAKEDIVKLAQEKDKISIEKGAISNRKEDLNYAISSAKNDMKTKIGETLDYLKNKAGQVVDNQVSKFKGDISELNKQVDMINGEMAATAEKLVNDVVPPVSKVRKLLSSSYDNVLEKNGKLTEEGMKSVDITETLENLMTRLNVPATSGGAKKTFGQFIKDVVVPNIPEAEAGKLIKLGESLNSEGQSIVLKDAHWIKQALNEYGRPLVNSPGGASYDLGKNLLNAAKQIGNEIEKVAGPEYKELGQKWRFMKQVEENVVDPSLGKILSVGKETYRKGMNLRDFVDTQGNPLPDKIQKFFTDQTDKVFAIEKQIDLLNGMDSPELTEYASKLSNSLNTLRDKAFSRDRLLSAITDTEKLMKSVDKDVRNTFSGMSTEVIDSLKKKVGQVEKSVIEKQRGLTEQSRGLEKQKLGIGLKEDELRGKLRKHDEMNLIALGVVSGAINQTLKPLGILSQVITAPLNLMVSLFAIHKYYPEFGYFTEKGISAVQKLIAKKMAGSSKVAQGLVNEYMRKITSEMYKKETEE